MDQRSANAASTYLPGVPAEMERLKREHRLRELTPARGIDFSSNDYLGLSRHPALREAVMEAMEQDGTVGAGGSRLLRGHHPAHARLEEFAAEFFRARRRFFSAAASSRISRSSAHFSSDTTQSYSTSIFTRASRRASTPRLPPATGRATTIRTPSRAASGAHARGAGASSSPSNPFTAWTAILPP